MKIVFYPHQYSGTKKPETATTAHAPKILEIFAGETDVELKEI